MYRNDINKVVLSQCVQDGGDSVSGDSHPQPLHAATCVYQNHYVLGRSSSLYVPLVDRKGQTNKGKMKARATTQPSLQSFLFEFCIQSLGQCPIEARLHPVP